MGALRSQRDAAVAGIARAEARAAFLSTYRVPGGVRSDIARSWIRSVAAGFTDPSVAWAISGSIPDRTPVCKAFDDEMQERLPTLSRLGLAATLVDASGIVVSTCGIPDGQENLHVVRAGSRPPIGASLHEARIGTHAANLALESEAPAQVEAHEHLHQRYLGTHSAAIPIMAITTPRVIAALVVESTTPAQSLLLPWAQEVAGAVRSRLRDLCQDHDMLLMRDFLSARAGNRFPVVCLDQQTMLCNAAASRLLGAGDQALLWEHASQFLQGNATDSAVFALSDAGSYLARFETIEGDPKAVGVRITLRPYKQRAESPRPAGSVPVALAAALPGHSRRRQRLIEELEAALASSDRVVLVGEPGTGKRHIARALLPTATIETDCSDEAELLTLLRARSLHPQPMIVTHLERLSDSGLIQVSQLLSAGTHLETPVLFTFTRDAGEPEALTQRGEAIGAWVQVPAVRDRLDDLPHLINALSARLAVDGQAPVRWMPDALQVLARVDWPDNVRSLESVVDKVARDCRTGYVDSRLLPEGVRARAAGRRMSRLEQLEAAEILASLRENGGNKLATAERLGIARSTLYRRMRALGMDMGAVNY